MLTIEQVSRLYAVPLTDYGRGSGLLVSSGCGIMMSVMDAAPSLRWCVDIDGLESSARLDDFLVLAARIVAPIGVCGWFSVTKPDVLLRAFAQMDPTPVLYLGNVRAGCVGEVGSLDAFIAQLSRRVA